jgi:TRAP-type C4-dicarboxylate transport system substrate-binding protein
MKYIITAAATALALSAGSAMAWEGRTVACFDKVWVPATYSATKVLVKPAKERYEHKNGRIELVHYSPVYREIKTMASKGHWVMKEVSCGCPACD